MLFNSFQFLIFFPVVTILYFLLPHKYRWFHLLVASCIFYAAFIPSYILILFFTIVIDYYAGIYLEKITGKKRYWFLVASLVANIGVLAIFKYYNFFISNINELLGTMGQGEDTLPLLGMILPIGLSFHTFQAMSYTIEVYRGNYKAEKHFGIYALYVMFYPQLVAGPIERPQNVLYQFHEKKFFKYKNAVSGLRLMLWGMFKKVVIADRLAMFTDPVFDNPSEYPPYIIALGAFFFAFQIFCDFSGYSDIALGSARVMGFHLMRNFDRPYHAKSISEFWKRWHISLSTWFRDYLYIPLGGNRVSVPRWYFNLFFVFLVSGFWHGANWTFIIWGGLHGFYLVAEILLEKLEVKVTGQPRTKNPSTLRVIFSRTVTFIFVVLAWVFFRAATVKDAMYILSRIPYTLSSIYTDFVLKTGGAKNFPMDKKGIVLSLILILFMEFVHYIQSRTDIVAQVEKRNMAIRWGIYYALLFGIIFLGVFEDRQFIYFQF